MGVSRIIGILVRALSQDRRWLAVEDFAMRQQLIARAGRLSLLHSSLAIGVAQHRHLKFI